MKSHFKKVQKPFVIFVWLCLVSFASAASMQNQSSSVVNTGQRTFSSAKQAANALFEAAKAADKGQIQVILGPEANDIVSSGDSVADNNARASFVQKYAQKHTLLAKTRGVDELQIGNDGWPFPVPIKENNGKWMFDSAAGRDEVIARRIGRNELATIRTCHAFVQAEHEYAKQSRDAGTAGVYAAKLFSDPGRQNGLYWEVKEGETPSPMGPLIADATSEGYGQGGGKEPFHGYFYRLLTAQGSAAPGGVKNYLENGNLKYGFALLAFPADYRNSGVMTFIVNQQGKVYQRDLGEKTAQAASQIQEYNPDKSWKLVR